MTLKFFSLLVCLPMTSLVPPVDSMDLSASVSEEGLMASFRLSQMLAVEAAAARLEDGGTVEGGALSVSADSLS